MRFNKSTKLILLDNVSELQCNKNSPFHCGLIWFDNFQLENKISIEKSITDFFIVFEMN